MKTKTLFFFISIFTITHTLLLPNGLLAQMVPFLLQDSFEAPVFMGKWKAHESCCSYSIKQSDSVKIDGKYSLRIELHKSDSLVAGSKRSELVLPYEKTPNIERWLAFSVFLPSNYSPDPSPECIAQWHEMPDVEYGETWRSPPISLQMQNGKWNIVILWATDSVNTNKTISGSINRSIGVVETGRWINWIFRVKFSHKQDGILQIWKDGMLVFDRTGPNYFNDIRGPYFKLGIYKWEWKMFPERSTTTTRVLFFDKVKIGEKKVGYKRMRE